MGEGFRWWVLLDIDESAQGSADAPAIVDEVKELLYEELDAWKGQARRLEESNRELRMIIARLQQGPAIALGSGMPSSDRPWWKKVLGQ